MSFCLATLWHERNRYLPGILGGATVVDFDPDLL